MAGTPDHHQRLGGQDERSAQARRTQHWGTWEGFHKHEGSLRQEEGTRSGCLNIILFILYPNTFRILTVVGETYISLL